MTVKIADKVVIAEDIDFNLALYDLTMNADLLIGLTLLKLGFATGLDEMDRIKDNYSLLVEGHDIRVLEKEMHDIKNDPNC